jgi:hypothetical protein
MKYYVFIIVLSILSCTKSGDYDELSTNQSKWNGFDIVNYEFSLRINCFCPSERVGPHLIKVVNDTIVSVNNLPYDISKTGELMTINQLFSYLKVSLEKNPYKETIEYNSGFGYPQNIYFDFIQTAADEEIGFQISDFKEI